MAISGEWEELMPGFERASLIQSVMERRDEASEPGKKSDLPDEITDTKTGRTGAASMTGSEAARMSSDPFWYLTQMWVSRSSG